MPLTTGIATGLSSPPSAKLPDSIRSQVAVVRRRRASPAGPTVCASTITRRAPFQFAPIPSASPRRQTPSRCSKSPSLDP